MPVFYIIDYETGQEISQEKLEAYNGFTSWNKAEKKAREFTKKNQEMTVTINVAFPRLKFKKGKKVGIYEDAHKNIKSYED